MAVVVIAALTALIIGGVFALKSLFGGDMRDWFSPRKLARGIQDRMPAPSTESVLRRGLDQLQRRSLTTINSKVLPTHAVLEVHPDLYRRIAPAWPRIARELSTVAAEMAQREGWESSGVSFSLRGNPVLGKWEVEVRPDYPEDDDVITVHTGSVFSTVPDDDEPTKGISWETKWFVELADGSSRELSAGRPLIVGKSSNCDITVRSPHVSRQHVRLFLNPAINAVEIKDLDSTNGTSVDGRAVAPHTEVVVRNDAVVGLGETDRIKLVYRAVRANRR